VDFWEGDSSWLGQMWETSSNHNRNKVLNELVILYELPVKTTQNLLNYIKKAILGRQKSWKWVVLNMNFEITPVFKDIFPDESSPNSIEEIIEGIPTEALIKTCCYINAQLYFAVDILKKEKEIFVHLIERTQDGAKRNLYFNRLNNFINKDGMTRNVGIFPLPHTLKIIEISILNSNSKQLGDLTAEQELSILKALLFLNSIADYSLGKSAKEAFTHKDEHTINKMFWSGLLNSSVLMLKKDFIICIYKALHFIRFLKIKFPKNCNTYTTKYKVQSLENILIKSLELYMNAYNKEKDYFAFNFPAGTIRENYVIEQFIMPGLSKDEFVKAGLNRNFKGIRNYPIIKFSNGDFSITNWSFFMDKFYEGLVFDFYKNSDLKRLPSYTLFDDYKNEVGSEFAQPFFSKTMKELFTRTGIVLWNEKERNESCNYDFYLRIRNHVFIFEFKDILFPIKETYEDIKATIDTKLVTGKGIKQLKQQLTNIAENPSKYDDCFASEFPLDRIFIYPIIVYTDISYGITGINDYLNGCFNKILPDEIRKKYFYVSPLLMMHFDFLLEYYDLLKSGEMDLVEVVNSCIQLKSLRIEVRKQNPCQKNVLGASEGFDVLLDSKYNIRKLLPTKSTLLEKVITDLKPHLPA